MKRLAPWALLALIPRAVFAGGVLNVLLAGAIAVLTVSSSPTSISYSYPAASFTSGSTTCSGHGGIPPYTYGWSWASGGTSISINSPSGASTSFTVSGAAVNTTYSGVAQCRATDARPVSSPYADVSISLTRIPLLPPSAGSATLVAGSASGYAGYNTSLSIGSLSSTTDYSGYSVRAIYCSSAAKLIVDVGQPSSNSGYITDVSVNGTVYPTSGASYSYLTSYGEWTWTGSGCPFVSGNSYPVFYY